MEAVRLGARGLILKEAPPEALVDCVRRVHRGEQWLEHESVARAFRNVDRETAARAAADLAVVTPRLTRVTKFVNALLNTLAYSPPGSEEGFLFWASWVNHAGATVFGTQDAHGPVRRGLVLISCSSLDVLEQLKQTNPQLGVLIELLNAPQRSQVCPTATPGTGSP